MKRIIQWNINGYKSQHELLQQLIIKEKAEIACLQETNLKENQTIILKNFTCINKNRVDCTSASGGVCILIKNNIYHKQIELNTILEAVAASVSIGNKTFTICNVYLSNKYEMSTEALQNLIAQLPTPLILLGDFNSHSKLWGSFKNDKRGNIIEDIITNNNLVLLNDTSPTHFNVSTGKNSAIDLTLCSNGIATSLEWAALDELYCSDHYPLIITFNKAEQDIKTHTSRWKYHKADWNKYRHIITKSMDELSNVIDEISNSNSININRAIKEFTNILIEAANLSIPKTKGHRETKNTPWWNDDCANSISNYKRALNKYKKTRSMADKIEFKRLKAVAKHTVKNSKKTSWLAYLQSINHQIPSKEMWAKIKSIEGRKQVNIPILNENNTIIDDPPHIANIMAHNFAANSSNNNYSPEFRNYKNKIESANIITTTSNDNNDLSFNKELTISELKHALSNCKNKSPGPDNIPNVFLKQLPESSYENLINIFNIIWTKNVFPDIWSEAIIIPLLKPGKINYDKNSYRPIALTSSICKIFEKIINKRLRNYLEANSILNKSQCGFREKCSTTDCLATIESNICEAFHDKQHLILVSLDMEKAYDLIWRRRVLQLLLNMNVTGNMFNFINNFLNRRSIKVKIQDSYSDPIDIENGVPQGSVISVTLFLIALNDIFSCLSPPVCSTTFADDVNLFIKGKNLKTSQTILQSSLNKLLEFANTTGFKFSENKTKAIIFSNKRVDTNDFNIYLGNCKIEIVKDIKVLGVIFDEKLTWKKHIENLKQQCLSRLNILKILSAKNWGTDQNTLIKTYKTLIQSKIDYGSIIYGSAKEYITCKLEPILNTSMRIASGVFTTSPVSSILSECYMMPLALRRKLLVLKYVTKILYLPNNQVFPLVMNIKNNQYNYSNNSKQPFYYRAKEYLQEFNIVLPEFYLHDPHTSINNNIRNIISEKVITDIHSQELRSIYGDYKNIYLHIKKYSNSIGAAAILPNKEQILLKLPYWYMCESALKILIVETLLTIQDTSENYIIHINSKKVAEDILNLNTREPIIVDIIINLTKNKSSNSLLFHANFQANVPKEIVNATETAIKLIYPIEKLKCTMIDFHKLIKIKINKGWNDLWKNDKKSSKLQIVKSNVFEHNPSLNFKRKDQIIISRLRIGHTFISHQHIFSKEQNYCELCNTPINRHHILINCPVLQNLRKKFKLKTDLRNILNSVKECEKVIKFIDEAKLRNLI